MDTLIRSREEWRAEIEKQVRAEVMSQAERLYLHERERGYVDGHADAIAEANAAGAREIERARDEMRIRFDSFQSSMQHAHEAALRSLRGSVGEIAFAAVCRLVSSKTISRALVVYVVEHVCAQLRKDLTATLRMHPRDVDEVTHLLGDRTVGIEATGLKIVPDASLQLGNCVVETNASDYDGSLETQLRRVHAALTGISDEISANARRAWAGST